MLERQFTFARSKLKRVLVVESQIKLFVQYLIYRRPGELLTQRSGLASTFPLQEVYARLISEG